MSVAEFSAGRLELAGVPVDPVVAFTGLFEPEEALNAGLVEPEEALNEGLVEPGKALDAGPVEPDVTFDAAIVELEEGVNN